MYHSPAAAGWGQGGYEQHKKQKLPQPGNLRMHHSPAAAGWGQAVRTGMAGGISRMETVILLGMVRLHAAGCMAGVGSMQRVST